MGRRNSLDQKVYPFYYRDMKGMNTKSEQAEQEANFVYKAQNARFDSVYGSVKKRQPLRYYNSSELGTSPIDGTFRYYSSTGITKLIIVTGGKAYVGTDASGTFTEIRSLTTSGKKPSFVIYKDLLIVSDGYNNPWVYDGATTNTTWELGSCKAALAAGGSNLDAAGAYYYAVGITYGGTEYLCGAVSNTVTTDAGNRKVTLTNVPLGPVGTTNRKIYRTIGDGNTLYLIDTIANNTAVTYADDVADTTATPMGAVSDDMPMGAVIKLSRERLFITRNPTYPNRIYYSKPYLPHCIWHTTDLDYMAIDENDGDEIMGIPMHMGVMLCFKRNTIRKIYTTAAPNGWDSSQWYAEDPHVWSGTPAPYSITETPYGIVYLGWDQWYLYDNAPSPLLEEFSHSNIASTQYRNTTGFWNKEIFYAAYADSTAASGYLDRVIVYDVKQKKLAIDTINANCFCSFSGDSETGEIAIGSSSDGFVYRANTGNLYYSLFDVTGCNAGTANTVGVGTDEDGFPFMNLGVSVAPTELPDGICIFWDSELTTPGDGWIEVTVGAYYLRVSTGTIGVTGGGSHVHTVAGTTGIDYGPDDNNQSGDAIFAADDHSHTYTGSSGAQDTLLRYVKLRIFKRVKGSTAAVYQFPIGALALWPLAAAPTGWVSAGHAGYYIQQGATSLLTNIDPGAHSHTYSGTTAATTGDPFSANLYAGPPWVSAARQTHGHTYSGTTGTFDSSSWETDWIGFNLIKRTGTEETNVSEYIYALCLETTATGWTDVTSTYNGRYLKIFSEGGTGASTVAAHVHSFSGTTSASDTNTNAASSGSGISYATHTHSYSGDTSSVSYTPPFYNVRLFQKVLGTMQTYNDSGTVQYTNGLWTSPAIQVNAQTFVSWRWNESLVAGDDINLFMRTAATSAVATPTAITTVDHTADKFTLISHGLSNTNRISLQATDIPTGLSKSIMYYVVGVSGADFQVSLTSGGAAVAFSSNGTAVTFLKWEGPHANANGTTPLSTANVYMMYALVFTAADTRVANPRITYGNGYLVRLEYAQASTFAETSVPFIYQIGLRNFQFPGTDKIFKKIITFHQAAEEIRGAVTVDWETENASDVLTIDLDQFEKTWTSFFQDSAMGTWVDITFSKDDLYDFELKEVQGAYSLMPLLT